jgi:hypothetical protein
MKPVRSNKPRARKEGLIIQTLPDETLVYDLDRDLAHCLNQTATSVWNRCDGSSTARQIARAVSNDLNHPVDEKFVWVALDQLGRNHLLMDGPPALTSAMNRREVVKALAISAAVAVPVVASIVAPVPAQAATGCLPNGASCTSSIQCCSNFCNGTTGQCGIPA